MKQKLMLFFVILAIIGCADNNEPVAVPDLSGKTCPSIVGVWPAWAEASSLRAESLKKLDQLALVFALPTSDGKLETTAIDQTLRYIKPLAEEAGVELILSIGGASGYDDAFIKLAGDPIARPRFVQSVVDYAIENKLSGIDVDWEIWSQQAIRGQGGNDPVESNLLLTLVRELRAGLPKDVTLSADIFAGSYYGPQYLPELEKHTDMINLMAFDFTGGWEESNVGHHAEAELFGRAIDDVVSRGFSANHLMLGLPAYGVEFHDGNTMRVTKVPNRKVAAVAGDKIEDAMERGRLGDIYFETPRITRRKVIDGLSRGVSGFFLFDLSQDHSDPTWSILDAVHSTVLETGCDW